MNRKWKDALDEFIRELKEKYKNKIDEIIIFGSYARGEAKEDSDIDILIIGDVKLDEVIDISFPILLKCGVYISPIIMSKDHYEFLKSEKTSLMRNILREGVRLYVRI